MSDMLGPITGIAGTLIAIGGFILTIVKTRQDKEQGVASTEAESKRDTVADRDALIDQFQEELASERKQRLEQEQRFESRLGHVERELAIERSWSQMLVHHIYRGLAPPPPARPTTP